ncbi:fructoselysine 6-kinase [Hathewaya proteolytica DSM 3090]|uniref:Fructoselysine 6-kinase n=1 Tax=Hathewaya proteolytica DSM 3090 TaxID=1121331 RepID=A0A1M6MD05_9CLOT|nr:fructoselysine 6-kinase [Hathewaya proteolytica]SHJ81300.1 fructoselysine 6-kinase [Hathewaya proteolytica DSM 3090]
MKFATVGDNCIDYYKSMNQGFPGGNPVNVAVYLRRLGEKVSYTGAVGDDTYGEFMIKSIQSKGVDTSHIKVLHGDTAMTEVELRGEERILGDYHEGVLCQFKLSSEDIDFLCSHDMVISGIWGMVEKDLWKIKQRHVPVAFDFATKVGDEKVLEIIADVDYAFFAYDNGDDDFIRSYMKDMKKLGPKLIIVTLGENGSLCYNGSTFIKYGIVPCTVKDTMGAGDSYIAGFLQGISKGWTIEKSMENGARNASITLQYHGAW